MNPEKGFRGSSKPSRNCNTSFKIKGLVFKKWLEKFCGSGLDFGAVVINLLDIKKSLVSFSQARFNLFLKFYFKPFAPEKSVSVVSASLRFALVRIAFEKFASANLAPERLA